MSGRRRAGGTTLVELMVGLAIALVVTAGCTLMWSAQLRAERSQYAEVQLAQELRAAVGLMTRDLRRAGYWPAAGDRAAAGDGRLPTNPYAVVETAADSVAYRHALDPDGGGEVDPNERFGFRLRAGALETQLGAGNWQALTDAATLTVTAFRIEPVVRTLDLSAFCIRSCAADGCPRQAVRSLGLTVVARLPGDAAVTRRVEDRVLVRNDLLAGGCAP